MTPLSQSLFDHATALNRVAAEEREQAIAYLRNDLEMTANVAGRMGAAL